MQRRCLSQVAETLFAIPIKSAPTHASERRSGGQKRQTTVAQPTNKCKAETLDKQQMT